MDGEVQSVDVGEGRAVDEHRPEGVEEDLKSAEEGLAEEGVKEEGLNSSRKIGIEACNTKGFMMR